MASRSNGVSRPKRMAQMLTACALCGFAALPAHAVMNVGVRLEGVLLGNSNFNDRTNVVVSYDHYQEYAVPGSLPPLWGTVRAFGESNGAAGTLKAHVAIQNSGPGNGGIPNTERTLQSYMTESIRLFSTNGTGSRNVGLAGLGDPNDNFVTVRAKGTLLGAGVVGSATGVPVGFPAASVGSTRAVFSLALGLDGSPLTSYIITDTTDIEGSTITRTDSELAINLGNSEIRGDSIVFNISKTYLANNPDTSIYFSSSLSATARVGNFGGAEAIANYQNSAYLDFDVEQGMFWLPDGTSATRKFLTAQVFPPAPVPEPGTLALWAAGLLGLALRLPHRRP